MLRILTRCCWARAACWRSSCSPPRWTTLVLVPSIFAGAWEWSGFRLSRAAAPRPLRAADRALLGSLALRAQTRRPARAAGGGRCSGGCWPCVCCSWRRTGSTRLRAVAAACLLVPAGIALRSACGPARAVRWLLYLLSWSGFAADTGAFFAGRRFGRHKLAPRVSPGQDLGGRGRWACGAGGARWRPCASGWAGRRTLFRCWRGGVLHRRRPGRKHVQALRGTQGQRR